MPLLGRHDLITSHGTGRSIVTFLTDGPRDLDFNPSSPTFSDRPGTAAPGFSLSGSAFTKLPANMQFVPMQIKVELANC